MSDKTREAPDLHAQIMNLPHKLPNEVMTDRMRLLYLSGHRDARHAAAELAAANAQEVKRLREALEDIIATDVLSPEGGHEAVAEIHCIARAALQGDK